MGKDTYHDIVEAVLKEIISKKFHRFREDQDPIRKITFYNASEPILRHMCACADRMVGLDSNYSELRGVIFERVAKQTYSRKHGDYTVDVGFMASGNKPEQKTNRQEAA